MPNDTEHVADGTEYGREPLNEIQQAWVDGGGEILGVTCCPACGSNKREWRGDLPHFDEEGNVTEYEDCPDAWHLEARTPSDPARVVLWVPRLPYRYQR